MAETSTELEVEITVGADCEEEELAELTRRLRAELLGLDVESIALVRADDGVAGAKSVDSVVAGALVVHSSIGVASLGAFTACVRGWLRRQRARSVRIRIGEDVLEVTGMSSAEQDRVTAAWIARNGSRS